MITRDQLISSWREQITVWRWRRPPLDMTALRRWLDQTCLTRPPAWSGLHPAWQDSSVHQDTAAGTRQIAHSGDLRFGGWCVLGPTSSYASGWYPNGALHSYGRDTPADFAHSTVRTEVCTGAMAETMDTLAQWGLQLSRARLTISKPGLGILWHTDSNTADELIVRIQLPMLTNPQHEFHSRTQRWHLPAQGSVFMLNTNWDHRTVNPGRDIRFNLIADIDLRSLPDTLDVELWPGQAHCDDQ